jgi:hypothetical protein
MTTLFLLRSINPQLSCDRVSVIKPFYCLFLRGWVGSSTGHAIAKILREEMANMQAQPYSSLAIIDDSFCSAA